MAGTLSFLGIHEGDIEHASDVLEAVCDKHGINSDCVWCAIYNFFDGPFASDHNINEGSFTSALINLFFNCLRDALLDIGIEDSRIDWEVNGICSDFYIDGEKAY